jgi:hypothetical protein
MRRLIPPAVALAALLAMAAGPADPPVTPEGYGWLKIGLSNEQAEAASPQPLTPWGSADASVCEEYWVGGKDSGVRFLTDEGWVGRVTISKSGPATPEGVQVGDPEAKVRQAYGAKVKREVAPYDEPPVHDLYVRLTPDRGYRFEIDAAGKVRAFHAGSEAIELLRGCG